MKTAKIQKESNENPSGIRQILQTHTQYKNIMRQGSTVTIENDQVNVGR